jgi:hypothetical protein
MLDHPPTLPAGFVADAGLPVLSPVEILRSTITIMDRARRDQPRAGGTPRQRWGGATGALLWQFAPTVITGGLSAKSFLGFSGEVLSCSAAVAGCRGSGSERPVYWLLGARGEIRRRSRLRQHPQSGSGSSDRQVRHRAMLYAELEIAKWLLHGTGKEHQYRDRG